MELWTVKAETGRFEVSGIGSFDAAWKFDGVVFATAHDEVRQQQLFRDVGLADRGPCALADGRVVQLFVAPVHA